MRLKENLVPSHRVSRGTDGRADSGQGAPGWTVSPSDRRAPQTPRSAWHQPSPAAGAHPPGPGVAAWPRPALGGLWRPLLAVQLESRSCPQPLTPPRFPPSRLRRVAAAVGFSSGWTGPERDSFVERRSAGRWTSPFRTFWIPPGQPLPSPSLSVAWHATPQTLLALSVRGHQPGRRALALQRQFFCVARRPCRAILPSSSG